MNKKDWVLITGASSGLGLEMAKILAEQGKSLILVSSSLEHLGTAVRYLPEETEVQLVEKDLSVPRAAEELFSAVQEKEMHISCLINNAGIGYSGPYEEMPPEQAEKMLNLNMQAVTQLCILFGREMKKSGSGSILNVASTGAFQPGPGTAAYYASKSYVLSFTKAIRQELKPSGVKVCCLCPGTLHTRFFEKEKRKVPAYAMDPSLAARKALKGLSRNQAVIIPGIHNRLMLLIPQNLRMNAAAVLKKKEKPLSII